MIDFLTNNWYQIAITLGIAIKWLVDRAKEKRLGKADVVDKIEDAYGSFVEHSANEVKKLFEKVADLEESQRVSQEERKVLLAKIEELETQSKMDKEKIEELEKQSKSDKAKIEDLTNKLDDYKSKISDLEKQIQKDGTNI